MSEYSKLIFQDKRLFNFEKWLILQHFLVTEVKWDIDYLWETTVFYTVNATFLVVIINNNIILWFSGWSYLKIIRRIRFGILALVIPTLTSPLKQNQYPLQGANNQFDKVFKMYIEWEATSMSIFNLLRILNRYLNMIIIININI